MNAGLPVDDLPGEGLIWNDVQNGLSLGYPASPKKGSWASSHNFFAGDLVPTF
jgi:hypothetical protein